MSNKKIITELSVQDLIDVQKSISGHILVIKFSAQWCNPCKLIKPTWDYWLQNNKQTNIIYVELDIDETMDLFIALKSKKMVKGVPTVLLFDGNIKRDHWFIPEDSFIGGDVDGFNLFLNRCVIRAQSI